MDEIEARSVGWFDNREVPPIQGRDRAILADSRLDHGTEPNPGSPELTERT